MSTARHTCRRAFVTLVFTALGIGCSGDGERDGGPASGDFCAAMAAFEAVQAEGDALFAPDDAAPDEFREVFDRFSTAIDAIVASAPDEIDSDVQLVAGTTRQLIDAFERADYDFVVLATDPQYAEVLASLDDDRITEANDRLALYVRDQCGPAPES